jgi:hypothetical protein
MKRWSGDKYRNTGADRWWRAGRTDNRNHVGTVRRRARVGEQARRNRTHRAHIVNQRTVEIMRHLGCEDDLLAVATPQEMMRNNL